MKNRFINFSYKIYSKMEESVILSSIKKGFMMVIPVFMIGFISLLLLNIPNETINDFIHDAFNHSIYNFLSFIYSATFKIASLYILLSVTYYYSLHYTKKPNAQNIICMMVSLGSYFAFLGLDKIVEINSNQESVILISYLDFSNVFTALLTAYLSTKFFFLFSKFRNKKNTKIKGLNTEEDYIFSLQAIMPMVLTIMSFVIMTSLISSVFDEDNLNDLVIHIFSLPFDYLGRSVHSAALLSTFQSLLWFFGVNGSNTLGSIYQDVFYVAEGEIITSNFFNAFVLIGGGGASLCLLIGMLIFSKNRNNKAITKNAVLPTFFNINEILAFGLTTVLNPIFLIPFILVPVVNVYISYYVISFGFVPMISESIYFTTPIFISGYLATESFLGIALQLLNLVVGIIIYLPFIKLYDLVHARKFGLGIDEMIEQTKTYEKERRSSEFLKNEKAITGKELALKLKDAIDNGSFDVFYQPLVKNGKVTASESLLRWKCGGDKPLYPPLVTSIAKESGLFTDLTKAIIIRVLNDIPTVLKEGKTIGVSVNVEANLLCTPQFIDWIIDEVNKRNIPKGILTIELTEETDLNDDVDLSPTFKKLKENGIKIAIDDFSMGHTSIKYLQNNAFDYVKLDGNITKNILDNKRVEDIVSNVVALGGALNFYVVAEYVETKEQKNKLHKLGVNYYQGYFYSKALPIDEYIAYIQSKKNKKTIKKEIVE